MGFRDRIIPAVPEQTLVETMIGYAHYMNRERIKVFLVRDTQAVPVGRNVHPNLTITKTIKGGDYQDIMAAQGGEGSPRPNKPANKFAEGDIWYFLDRIETNGPKDSY